MKKGWVVVGFAVLASALASPGWSQGTERSLDIQPGARENALGAAGVALVGDPSDALWWNPAALGFAETFGAQYTHVRLLPGLADDIMYNYAAGAVPLGNQVGLGASGTFLNFGGPWHGTEWSAAGAVGFRFMPELAAGITLKYARQDAGLLGGHASVFGFDLGGLYRTTVRSVTLSAGVNAQNLGPEMSTAYGGHDPLSRNLKLGGAAARTVAVGNDWETGGILLFDFNQSFVTTEFRTYHYGAELHGTYRNQVRGALRGGYYDDPSGEIGDFTYGAGVRVLGAALDFAAIPQAKHSDLPYVHKWTFGLHSDDLLRARSGR